MRINHNIAALNTNRALASNNSATSKSLEKLSSGFAINRAGDNAAGLAISEKMRGQIRGLDQAGKNANDGISLIQTAEGGLNETHSILDRMRELAVQSANDTNTDEDRKTIQKEIDQLTKEITRISEQTEFNTQSLLSGDMNATCELTFSPTAAADTTFEYGPIINSMEKIDVNETYTGTVTYIHKGDKMATPTDAAGNEAPASANVNLSNFDKASTLPDATYELRVENVDDLLGATCSVVLYKDNAVCTDPAISVDVPNFRADSAKAIDLGGELSGIKVNLYTTGTWSDDTSLGYFAVETAEEDSTKVDWVDSQGNALDARTAEENFFFRFADTAQSGTTVTIGNIKDERLTFHIGANAGQNTKFGVPDTSAYALGVDDINLLTQATSEKAITEIDLAINRVSSVRASLGAMQNRLEHTINNLGTSSENLAAAESQIRDADMAEEMSEFTKNNILVQAATSMLAQANQMPQSVLSLLQG